MAFSEISGAPYGLVGLLIAFVLGFVAERVGHFVKRWWTS